MFFTRPTNANGTSKLPYLVCPISLPLGPEEQMNRMEAMRRARDKLQAEVDAAATVEAEKMKEVCVHSVLIESVLC